MKVDLRLKFSHYCDHAIPVWKLLPQEVRGKIYATPEAQAYLPVLGITDWVDDKQFFTDKSSDKSSDKSEDAVWIVCGGKIAESGRKREHLILQDHGIGQSWGADPNTAIARHAHFAGGINQEQVGLYLAGSEHAANRQRKYYPKCMTVAVGCCKPIPKVKFKESGYPRVALSSHWSCYIVPESMGAWPEYKNAYDNLLRRQGYEFYGHAHPRLRDLQTFFKERNVPFLSRFENVMRMADVYVTDGCSTLYEFALTGKPVIVLNNEGYRRNRNHGLRFWDAAHVGINVDVPDWHKLYDALYAAISDDSSLQVARNDALRKVYPPCTFDGSAAQVAADSILAYLLSL